MELWIRSQDKMEFAKIEDIFISQDKINRIIGYSQGIKCLLGDYETYERALEVLDEISNLIMGKDMIDLANNEGLNMNNIYPILSYEMPKE